MILLDILDAVFRLLTGGLPLQPVTLALALMVVGMGWMFGKLTTRLGFIRTSLALIAGLYFYMVFAQTQFFGVHLFLIGLLLNHLPLFVRIGSWAQGLGDWWFALRYRRTFEDMRTHERDAEDRAREARKAYHSQSGKNDQQSQWRAEAQARRGRKTTQSGNQRAKAEKRRPNFGKTALPTEQQGYLQTLGLDPFGAYSLAEIRTAYRRMAKQTHPDLGGSVQHFSAVQTAFEWLVKRG